MALTNSKRIVSEIDGVLCSIVEDKVSNSRALFLKDLLEFNRLSVKINETTNSVEGAGSHFIVGVTDTAFNPIIAVYEKRLYSRKGLIVTPAFWNQENEDLNVPYWTKGRKIIGIYREESKF